MKLLSVLCSIQDGFGFALTLDPLSKLNKVQTCVYWGEQRGKKYFPDYPTEQTGNRYL